ncbi:MAG: MoaD/ThiS family protein, partial [Dehalococcoidia bacterium]|nr:MoaD/ThiS family protein [Dehalococcoidia bacterium]
WVSMSLGGQSNRRLVLEEDIENGDTAGSLLARLAARHQEFGEKAFDIASGRLTGQVTVIYNGLQLELRDGLKTRLADGDVLLLLPAFSGGSALEVSLVSTG